MSRPTVESLQSRPEVPKLWTGMTRERLLRADSAVDDLLAEYDWFQIERIATLLNHHVQDHFHPKEEEPNGTSVATRK